MVFKMLNIPDEILPVRKWRDTRVTEGFNFIRYTLCRESEQIKHRVAAAGSTLLISVSHVFCLQLSHGFLVDARQSVTIPKKK